MPDFGPGPKLHLLKSRTNTVVHCCNSMASVQGTLGEMSRQVGPKPKPLICIAEKLLAFSLTQ